MTCPKCGFEQPKGEECRACGLIFSKYRPYPSASDNSLDETTSANDGSLRGWRYYFRIFRWVSVSVGLLVLVLLLWPASPPEVQVDAGSVARASAKMREIRSDFYSGAGGTLELSESELNAWLQTNLDLPANRKGRGGTGTVSDLAVPANGRPVESFGVAEVEEVQSSISDVRVALAGDRVRAHVAFSLYGKAMSFQLEGRVRAENGYLRLEPTAGKVGVLPLPAATLGQAVNQVFDAPKNREKFRLPDAIEDIRVVDSRLRVRLRKAR